MEVDINKLMEQKGKLMAELEEMNQTVAFQALEQQKKWLWSFYAQMRLLDSRPYITNNEFSHFCDLMTDRLRTDFTQLNPEQRMKAITINIPKNKHHSSNNNNNNNNNDNKEKEQNSHSKSDSVGLNEMILNESALTRKPSKSTTTIKIKVLEYSTLQAMMNRVIEDINIDLHKVSKKMDQAKDDRKTTNMLTRRLSANLGKKAILLNELKQTNQTNNHLDEEEWIHEGQKNVDNTGSIIQVCLYNCHWHMLLCFSVCIYACVCVCLCLCLCVCTLGVTVRYAKCVWICMTVCHMWLYFCVYVCVCVYVCTLGVTHSTMPKVC